MYVYKIVRLDVSPLVYVLMLICLSPVSNDFGDTNYLISKNIFVQIKFLYQIKFVVRSISPEKIPFELFLVENSHTASLVARR